ncbi:HAMP domain-containing histidine kinase [Sulfidibacter corallicola]|uniref:histidine kinase n=1 Tax=Sulfidibacter corallicola TaxID=2818388 RepID=A0A8A4THR9_SULCO|nr:HAMP domain-containing sensor histidine kinase [Sulfidibacter corallicola]QTD49599.1 HAMP domain-containing histidine kinase [Sulfidibacter corallicola]
MAFFRGTSLSTQERQFWGLLLLGIFAVFVPTIFMLWFMWKAVGNEDAAVRNQLLSLYERRLDELARSADDYRRQLWLALADSEPDRPAAHRFAEVVTAGALDSVVVLGANGHIVYPDPTPAPIAPVHRDPQLEAARLAESRDADWPAALARYRSVASRAGLVTTRLQALLGQARCLVALQRSEEAVTLLVSELNRPEYLEARDERGRAPAMDGLVDALALMDLEEATRAPLANGLLRRLGDYGAFHLPASQRLELLGRLERVAPDHWQHDHLLRGEELARQFAASGASVPDDGSFHQVSDGLWAMLPSGSDLVGLFGEERLRQELSRHMVTLETGWLVDVLAPGQAPQTGNEGRAVALGEGFPDWVLSLSVDNRELLVTRARSRRAMYITSGIMVVGLILVLGGIITRFLTGHILETRLKNDLLATVTHELKTPLASVRMLVDTLLDGHYRDSHTTREYLELIAKENQRLSRLIEHFLNYSRLERHKTGFQMSSVSVTQIAETALEAIGDKLRHEGFRTDREWEPDLPRIRADADAMTTVVLNLLDNAIKYSREEKWIQVRSYLEDRHHVCLEVQDHGIGISRRALRKIFNRFFQADRSLTREAEGVGLGLNIVKLILDAHGGRIRVKTHPGKGSTFTVVMPVAGSRR